jgi:enoyl-CoA hydratase/carnithine racemase
MIEYRQQGSLGTLSIRRADKKNAFTLSMWRELGEHCRRLAAEQGGREAPRVLVLQGLPGAFCAGADIEEMATLLRDPAALAAHNVTVAQAQVALERVPIPTLAAIDGPCFGGGFGIAAACDFRLGTPRSRFAVTPARLGLLYSLEDTRRLVRLVGDARARLLLLRGEAIDAETALQWGILSDNVEPHALDETARTWADKLAAQSRASMAGLKATLGHVSAHGAADEAELRALFDAAFRSPDFAEGAAAFAERRPPRFQ